MTNILTKLRTLFSQRKTTAPRPNLEQDAAPTAPNQESDMEARQNLDAAALKNLMASLEHTHEGMYDCEATFALLDEYVELIVNHEEEAASLMPYVRRHLEMCPDCHEAYEVLHRILESESTAGPSH